MNYSDLPTEILTLSPGGDLVCECGAIFKLTPQAGGKWTYNILHTFHGYDGNGLTYDDKGHLFGTTVGGGKLKSRAVVLKSGDFAH